MALRQLILHVGGEKTGTSSLQRLLATNAARLLSDHGLLYPTAGPLFAGDAHGPFAAALLPPGQAEFVEPGRLLTPAAARAALDAQYAQSGVARVLLSSEQLSSRLDADAISRLRALTADLDVTVVYYARRQDELLIGACAERLKVGERAWPRFDAAVARDRYFDHAAILDDWVRSFGRDAVRVRGYLAHGIERDFLESLDIPLPVEVLATSSRLNPGLSLGEARLLYVLSFVLPDWRSAYAAGRPQDFQRAQQLRMRALRALRKLSGQRPGRPLTAALGARDRARVLHSFADSNRRLRTVYGVDLG